MRLLTVFGFKQFWTSDYILLSALIVLSHYALKIGRINKIPKGAKYPDNYKKRVFLVGGTKKPNTD